MSGGLQDEWEFLDVQRAQKAVTSCACCRMKEDVSNEIKFSSTNLKSEEGLKLLSKVAPQKVVSLNTRLTLTPQVLSFPLC